MHDTCAAGKMCADYTLTMQKKVLCLASHVNTDQKRQEIRVE